MPRLLSMSPAKASITKSIGLIAALAASSAIAQAQGVKVQIACTATSDCASAIVARDEGLFAKRGIDADMTLIGINTNIPPAIVSNSIQIGGPTAPVFLQAVDGGLDLVAVGGASSMDPTSNTSIAAVVRNGVEAKVAKDFIGKKVGAPGIGAFLHVLFVKWLIENGVDPAQVNFVEVTFPTMSDALKSSAVDVVLTAEPFVTRIERAGVGKATVHYALELARPDPIILYAATRAYVEKNPEVIKNFRAAIEEAAVIVNGDRDKANLAISKFTKQPLEIVNLNRPNISTPKITAAQFTWWLDVMKQQGMLQSKVDVGKLVAP